MDWTIRPLDNWTFFKDFFDHFWTNIWTIFWVILLTICGGGGERGRKIISMKQTLSLREGWETDY